MPDETQPDRLCRWRLLAVGAAVTSLSISESHGGDPPAREPSRWSQRPFDWVTLGVIAAVGLFLFLDVILPRGATAAIGYALVPVLGAAKRKIRFVLALTIVCTVLTWIGY